MNTWNKGHQNSGYGKALTNDLKTWLIEIQQSDWLVIVV